MPIAHAQLRGMSIANKPIDIARCGLSHAQFAQDCRTHRWYQLSAEGPIIGSPINFDFYRNVEDKRPSVIQEKALTKV